MDSFQVGWLGHHFICEFHDNNVMIHRYSVSQVTIPGNYISKCHDNNAGGWRGSHKGESEAYLEGRDYTLCRKSSHRVLDSLNHSKLIESYPFLATTLLFRKVRNGKNIEKYQRLLFLMWASVPFRSISGLTWYVSSAQQQASLGWKCQNHAGPVQRFMGESGRYLSEPCCGHHITRRLLDLTWSSYCSLTRALQIALFVIGVAGMIEFIFFIFRYHWPISRIWKKCFVERGCRDYSSWPYNDFQRCSARHHQWFHFKAGGSSLGVGPDTSAAEGQAWVWRATCVLLTISYVAYFFWDGRRVDIYGGDDTGASSGGCQGGATWSV